MCPLIKIKDFMTYCLSPQLEQNQFDFDNPPPLPTPHLSLNIHDGRELLHVAAGEERVGQSLSQGGVRPDPASGRVLGLGDPEELRDELALGCSELPLRLGPHQVALGVPVLSVIGIAL